jgi:serine/threonine-protein kinase
MIEQVGRYRIERELGRGGMGVVYLADDPALGRKVAIKTIHFEITDAGQREYLRTQLLRDARSSAGLSHPNVVNVHDILESGDTTYLVMEYIPGETLASRMQRPPIPDAAWFLRVLRDIAGALDYTHRKGVVHRDVKPGNIMIDTHQRVRIMDFGLARATEHREGTSSGLVAGTIQYMSPEQIRGDALDGRADQFSMAAVAYEMLTGKPLFEATSPITMAQKIINETPVAAHVQNPNLPETSSAVLSKALDRAPSGRYPTCTAFLDALIATFDGETVQALLRPPEEQPTVALTGMIDVDPAPKPPTVPPPQPGRFSGYVPVLIGVGLVLGSVGVTAVALRNGRTNGEPATRPERVYGPPPIIGRGSEVPEKKVVKLPPKMAATGAGTGVSPGPAPMVRLPEPPPGPEGFPPADDEPYDERRPKDHRKHPRRDIPGKPFGMPDFSREVQGPAPNLIEEGRRQLAARNFGIAIDLFTAAVKMAPDDYHTLFYRGAARLGAGNAKEAEADFQRVVRLKPDYAQGWFQLGVAMERQRHFKEALDSYAKAVSLKPDMSDAFFNSAMIYDQQLSPKKALDELNKAIAATPNYGRGYQARAEIKKKMGDPSSKEDQQMAKQIAAQKKPPVPPQPPPRRRNEIRPPATSPSSTSPASPSGAREAEPPTPSPAPATPSRPQ